MTTTRFASSRQPSKHRAQNGGCASEGITTGVEDLVATGALQGHRTAPVATMHVLAHLRDDSIIGITYGLMRFFDVVAIGDDVDSSQFDTVTKAWAAGVPRREVLRLVLG